MELKTLTSGDVVDYPCSPRGDGNALQHHIRYVDAVYKVDYPCSPRGDGNNNVDIIEGTPGSLLITPAPREGPEKSGRGGMGQGEGGGVITPAPREGTETRPRR